jgi:hypothetical protein
MNIADILKSILEKQGTVTLSAEDLKKAQGKDIGMIETWDDKGNKSFTIYTHQTRKK